MKKDKIGKIAMILSIAWFVGTIIWVIYAKNQVRYIDGPIYIGDEVYQGGIEYGYNGTHLLIIICVNAFLSLGMFFGGYTIFKKKKSIS